MTSHALLTRLDQLQSETLAVLDRANRLVYGEPADARDGLALVRRELIGALREYQAFKHERLFDPAIASDSLSLAEAGRRLKADCIGGGEAFHRYLRQWSDKDLMVEWPAFKLATTEVGRKLRDQIAVEGAQIRSLLAEAARRGGPPSLID